MELELKQAVIDDCNLIIQNMQEEDKELDTAYDYTNLKYVIECVNHPNEWYNNALKYGSIMIKNGFPSNNVRRVVSQYNCLGHMLSGIIITN